MKTFSILFLLATAFVIHEVANYTIDSDNVEISFYFPGDKLNGKVGDFKAEIHFDVEDLADSHLEGSILVASLETGDKGRDDHLKSADYFEIETYPMMSFKSTSMERTDAGIVVTGSMTIKETSREEKITMNYKDGAFVGTTSIFLDDYGVKMSKTHEGNQVDINFKIPAIAG